MQEGTARWGQVVGSNPHLLNTSAQHGGANGQQGDIATFVGANRLGTHQKRSLRLKTFQIRTTASRNGIVGCGERACSGRLRWNFDILRLTTRGLVRLRRLGSR